MTNIQWITVRVSNLERTLAFYKEFFGITNVQEISPNPVMKVAFLTADNGMKLELVWHEGEDACALGTDRVSVGFATTEFDSLLELAREQGILDSEPVTVPDGTQFFFVHDPEGNHIQVIRARQ